MDLKTSITNYKTKLTQIEQILFDKFIDDFKNQIINNCKDTNEMFLTKHNNGFNFRLIFTKSMRLKNIFNIVSFSLFNKKIDSTDDFYNSNFYKYVFKDILNDINLTIYKTDNQTEYFYDITIQIK